MLIGELRVGMIVEVQRGPHLYNKTFGEIVSINAKRQTICIKTVVDIDSDGIVPRYFNKKITAVICSVIPRFKVGDIVRHLRAIHSYDSEIVGVYERGGTLTWAIAHLHDKRITAAATEDMLEYGDLIDALGKE